MPQEVRRCLDSVRKRSALSFLSGEYKYLVSHGMIEINSTDDHEVRLLKLGLDEACSKHHVELLTLRE